MSTRSTQKTEDMLDQTFANFDSQVTGIEEEMTGKGGKSGGKSSNSMVLIATGVAAVGAIAYLFMFRGGEQPQPQPQQQAPVAQVAPDANAQQPAQTASAPGVAPQAVAPTLPVPDANAQQQAPSVPQVPALPTPDANAQQQAPSVPQVPALPTPGANTQQQTPVVPPVAQVAPVLPTVPAVTPMTQAVPAPTSAAVPALPTVTPKAESSVNVSNLVIENLQKQFELQSKELKDGLSEINGKVSAVEEVLKSQVEINQSVSDRLTKLESGKPTKEVKSEKMKKIKQQKQEEKPVTEVAEEEPVVVKKNYTKKKAKVTPMVSKKEVKAIDSKEDEVLVDKTTEKKTQAVAKEVVKEVKSSLPSVNIHSIFTGRVWIKNADGSLSTFSEGDTLPTGEKIKQINDEKFEIITNKRTISK